MNKHVTERKEGDYAAGIAHAKSQLLRLRQEEGLGLSNADMIDCGIRLNRFPSIDFHNGVLDTLNTEIPEYSFATDYDCSLYSVWAKRKRH